MKTFSVIVLALLMVSVTEQQVQPVGVEEKPDFENEACTNLSTIIATTSERMDSLKKKRMEIEELREDLKTAIDVEKALENEVPNLTVQIQEIQDTCTDFVPQDCCQIMIASNSSSQTGLYEIKDPCAGDREFIKDYKMYVRCDMETDGGGWIVIQRRIANGTVNFYRNWEDYENGFGDLDGEFWIGLRNMHELTNQEVELQVTAWNDNKTITWNYPTFRVYNADYNYYFTVSRGTGDGTDVLAYNSGHYFMTFDHDHGYRYGHCVSSFQAGWWYFPSRYIYINGRRYRKYCSNVNLNGRHKSSNLPEDSVARIHWATPGNTFTNTEMKIRSTTCGLGGYRQTV